jgi:hypothetical protein
LRLTNILSFHLLILWEILSKDYGWGFIINWLKFWFELIDENRLESSIIN